MNFKFNILIIASFLLFGCGKIEVFESKDGTEVIGFETYIGRDAMTKASSYGLTTLPSGVGVYGFYSGADTWADTDAPNLWTNLELTYSGGTWSYDQNQKKYWTNSKDNYTFLSYAPLADETEETGNGLVASTGANPSITYTVPPDLSKQIDLLYSNNNKNIHKPASGTTVTLQHQHALSRLTVKATAEVDEYAYTFHVKEISIAGNFNTKGSLNLYEGTWGSLTSKQETYTFFTSTAPATADNALGEEEVDYAINNTADGSVADNYLMMIPVNFATGAANLIVKYTVLYGGVESIVKTANLPISTNFERGKAYAINLNFGFDPNNIIKFTCELDKDPDGDGEEDPDSWNDETIAIQ